MGESDAKRINPLNSLRCSPLKGGQSSMAKLFLATLCDDVREETGSARRDEDVRGVREVVRRGCLIPRWTSGALRSPPLASSISRLRVL